MTMQGIDCASYQAGIDPSVVPCDFVIVKSTQGTTYTNPDFQRLAEATLAAGKALGIYHYASGGNATDEANYMLDVAGGYIGRAIFCLDWEGIQNNLFESGRDAAWIDEFCSVIENRVGSECLVYLSKSVMEYAAGHKLWVAQYANMNPTGYQDSPWNEGAYDCAIRQYTSTGRLDGWDGNLDLDKAYMSREEWDAWCGGASQPSQSNGAGLVVDGLWGSATTTALQRHFGTPVDGIVSGQWTWRKPILKACTTGWQFSADAGGSLLIAAMQCTLGIPDDGVAGPQFVNALEQHYGYPPDGRLDYPSNTVRRMQETLNAGGF
mgnify:FL=1